MVCFQLRLDSLGELHANFLEYSELLTVQAYMISYYTFNFYKGGMQEK